LTVLQDSPEPLMRRFIQHVHSGHFKDAKVFIGLVEAMVVAKDKELRGHGMQNLKYNPHFNAFMHLVRTISPQAYRMLSLEIKTPTIRGLQ
jgi:hypothetical protein